jgi:hypothetical protein
MHQLGSSSDKTYTHAYHRSYPSLFASQNISRFSTFKMLEIGFGQGGSVPLWEELFPNADIVWIDYSDDLSRSPCIPGGRYCQAGNRSRYYFGSQSNEIFLSSVVKQECHDTSKTQPCFDIIIDDGGHGYNQQLVSFRVLFPTALKPGALYIVEDIETSYWTFGEQYGDLTHGGVNAPHTPINTWKRFVDVLNREFFHHEYVSDLRVGASVENMIRSVSFHHNMMTATRKNLNDIRLDASQFNARPYRFRRRVDNWNSGTATVVSRVDDSQHSSSESTDYAWCVERMHRLPSRARGGHPRTNEDSDIVHLFDDLCQNQGKRSKSCDDQRSVHYSLMGEGVGSGFHLLAHALMFATVDRRVLVEDVNHFIDLDMPDSTSFSTFFMPPTPCSNDSRLECYLAPLSKCRGEDVSLTVKRRANMPVWNLKDLMTLEKRLDEPDHVRSAWYSFHHAQEAHGWGSVQNYLPTSYDHKSRLWFKSQVIWWLVQPSLRVAQEVRALQRTMGLEKLDPVSDKMIVMHVRRGDKALDPVIQQQQQTKDKQSNFHIQMSDYVAAAREIAAIHFPPKAQLRVLLMTEDQTVIDETSLYTDIQWYYTQDHKRQTTPLKISAAIKSGKLNGDGEMMIALRNLFLATVEGDAFIGTFSSNWSRLVFEMMIGRNGGRVPPHKSMDMPWYP